MGVSILTPLVSANSRKIMRQDSGNASVEIRLLESVVVTASIVPVYEPAKNLASLRVTAAERSERIVSSESTASVPWSGIGVDAYRRSPRILLE